MYSKQNISPAPGRAVWRRFTHKGYAAFASLRLEVCIGVLSVATLGAAARESESLSTRPARHAQEDSDDKASDMEELTVTGALAPLTRLQGARIVGVIERRDIERAAAESVNDVLKLVSGVDVRQRGGHGIQTDVSLDGGTFDQITILLNGVNISNPHTGHLAADLPLTAADIERVEVLEGAAGRVYGGQSFGGVINIVTRRDTGTSAEAELSGGSYGTVEGSARATLTTGRATNRLSGGGGRSDGGSDNSAWRKGQLYLQGGMDTRGASLDWQAGYSRKDYGANTFYGAAWPDQHERNERYTASVGAETKGAVSIAPTVYWSRAYDHYQLTHGSPKGENFHRSDVYGARGAARAVWRLGTTALAAELRHEAILSTSLGRDLSPQETLPAKGGGDARYTRGDARTVVTYSLEHNVLLSRWTVSAGVTARAAGVTGQRLQLYPGADVAYRPGKGWKVFLSYDRGSRLPTFTELYYKSVTHEGNRGLRPETNHSMQAGAQYRRPGAEATARAFLHLGRGMIDWVMREEGDTYHSAAFDLDNAGAQLQGRLDPPALTGRDTWVRAVAAGYTYIHQKRRDEAEVYKSNYAMEYLRHKATLSLTHRVAPRVEATWTARYQRRMGAYTAPGGSLTPYSPYATLDVKVRWAGPHWTLFAQATNLTGHRYRDLGDVEQPGAWITAGAGWRM